MSPAVAAGTAAAGARTWQRLVWAHPEWTVVVAAAAAWMLLLMPAGQPLPGSSAHPGTHTTTAGHGHVAAVPDASAAALLAALPSAALTSAIMSAAMMLPAVLPAARAVALTSRWHRRQRALAVFLACYLTVWTAFGVVVTVLLGLVGAGGGARWLGSVALLGAAAWESSPQKARYLRACHRLPTSGNDGWRADRACARAGIGHARACLGACWAVMAAMYVVGSSTLLVMVASTAVVWAGKVLAAGPRLGTRTAVVLVATAVVVVPW